MTAVEPVLYERALFPPPVGVMAGANISGMDAYRALTAEADRDYEGFWGRLAKETLSWNKPFTKVLDESKAPFYTWFEDGELNASYNSLDRHVEAGNGERVAIVFEADDGTVTNVTYQDLLQRVSRDLYANVDRRHRRHAGLRADRRDALGGVRRLLVEVAE
jgi:acetyl-CoA synthetase